MPTTQSVQVLDVENLLRDCLKCDKLELVDLTTTRLLPPGENYCSIMVKLQAVVRKDKTSPYETLHLVAKTLNRSERPIIDWYQVFKKEVLIYAYLVPAYQNLEREMGIEPILDVLPGYVGHRCSLNGGIDDLDVVDEHSLLLMDNLKARGYYNCERRIGLDYDHAKLALTSLARYHSLGIALKRKRPDVFAKAVAQANVIGIDMEQIDDGLVGILRAFRDTPSLCAKHRVVIESCFDEAKCGDSWSSPGDEPWLTITHGDFWTNNICFRDNDDGRVDDVKFVDFQTYVYNSPLRDLPYFICGSLDEPTKSNRVDELLVVYRDTFVKNLARLGCETKMFNGEAFEAELKRQAVKGFPWCAMAIKFFVHDVDDDEGKVNADDVFRSGNSGAYVKKLLELVKVYEDRKWF